MSATSRDILIAKSEEREKIIQQFIDQNPKCDTNMVVNAFQYDEISPVKVYDLPRHLLRLNPENGRFKAELDIIRDERKSAGKPLELDPDDDDDVKTIRDMIKGIHPKNAERENAFKKLYDNIYEVSQKTGTNGQEVPGLITSDGILVNGNRRDTVMEELTETTKKKKGEPLKYNSIRVGILDKGVSTYDLWKNEAKEQISQESREEYDYVNSALEIKRGYALLRKKGLTDKKAKDEISKTLYGRSAKDVEAYIDFLKIADLFLKQIGKKDQYRYIQESGGGSGEKGIVTILQEVAKQRTKYEKEDLPTDVLTKWFKAVSLFCVLSKIKPSVTKSGKTRKLTFGHREFRLFQRKAMATNETRKRVLDAPVLSTVNLAKPTSEHAYEFNQAIDRAQGLFDVEEAIADPLTLLEKARDSLSKVSQDLNSSHKKEMLKLIHATKGDQYIKDIKSLISDITKKISKNK